MWEAAYEAAYEVWEELNKIVLSPSPLSPHFPLSPHSPHSAFFSKP
ncbi:MAG: hypothetical protein F6J93_29515 [Oscillatoria sp. SIO1A7]|nr:hypothetical protein [Oscillatoria sp. SIO1A7]